MKSEQLRVARRRGAKLVTEFGVEVAYRPRYKGDRKPWVMGRTPLNTAEFRCRASDVYIVRREGA